MKKITKFLCFILCVVLVSVSLPVYVSAESGFVSFNVIGSADGEKEVFEEYGYSDGTHLYVSTDFLTRYMPYSYDASQNMFTRINHEAGSWFGTVKVDPQAKQATLYMNTFSNKTYNLHDALYFGNRLYLPIDQMAALLKTTLLHEESEGEHYIAIGCCEYSICDAEYALSKIQNHKYLYFDYPEIIDEIFYGNDTLFYSATVLSYFSSTIFGFRLDQLDVLFKSGKVNDYRDYLDRCILDNEAYMTYVLDEDSVGYRFIETMNLNSKVGGISSDLEEYLSYVKELTEPFKDSSLSGSSFYKDASDYAAIFGTIGEVCEWADFIMKYESVLNDNYDMLSYYIAFSSLLSEEIPFIKAVVETSNTYSEDYVLMGLQKLHDSLSDLLSGYGTKEALKTIFPEIEIVFLAIKAINLVTQALGIDLTDNTNYSILLECAARNSIGSYARDLPDDHFTGVSSVEKYRTANLFWVLGSKQIFDSANKLNAKYGGGSSVYDSRKDVLCQVAGLFYLAAQGEGFDDYPSIDRLISQNHTQIQNSNALTNFSDVSEEDIPEREENEHNEDTPNDDVVYSGIKVGDIIEFGLYEQDNNMTNGKEPIEWHVIDVQGDKAFLLSKNSLDYQKYNEERCAVTWETCTLRAWLNDYFYNTAFNETEKSRILTTTVPADEKESYDTDPGNDTQDKVFLLSIEEVKEYNYDEYDIMKSESTKYACAQYYDGVSMWVGYWWLRTPGDKSNRTVTVLNGSFWLSGGELVDTLEEVRPAMWIEIN